MSNARRFSKELISKSLIQLAVAEALLWLVIVLWRALSPEHAFTWPQSGLLFALTALLVLAFSWGHARRLWLLLQQDQQHQHELHQYAQIIDHLPDAYLRISLDGTIQFASASSQDVLGYRNDLLVGSNILDLYINPHERASVLERIVGADGRVVSVDTYWQHGNGQRIWCQSRSRIVKDKAGSYIEASIRDMSEKRQLLIEFSDSRELLNQVLDAMPHMVLVMRRDQQVVVVNRLFAEFVGEMPEQMQGHYVDAIAAYESHVHPLLEWSVDEQQLGSATRDLVLPDGECSTFEMRRCYVDSKAQGELALYLFTDRTELVEKERTIALHKHFDELTTLPNKQQFLSHLQQTIILARNDYLRVGVLVLNLDGFRRINDSFGLEHGDALLKAVAERLRTAAHEGHFLARLSGDEFGLVVSNIHRQDELQRIAEHLLGMFQQAYSLDEVDVVINASIGISCFPDDADSAEVLLREASTALNSAKERGGKRYFFFQPTLNTAVSRHLNMEKMLRQALIKNEFYLVFQPLICAVTGQPRGAEALIRWRNPDLGDVRPDEFIPFAEQTRDILEIGRWVMNNALSAAARWRRLDPEFYVAVNLSPLQLLELDIVAEVQKALHLHQLAPGALELEITEGVLLENTERANDVLNALRAINVRLSLDDFGTGYSALNYLKRFPFNTLKIDRSFVNDLVVGSVDESLVKAMVAMADGMGLDVVAEGVEHRDQVELLTSLHVRYLQGYYFAKPMTLDQFEQWFANQKFESNELISNLHGVQHADR